MQLKIHNEGNPGRPPISSLNCHTSQISEYVDFHLQLIVTQVPSYVKDTTDFLRKLDAMKSVPEIAYLVSPDVKSLYASILNAEA